MSLATRETFCIQEARGPFEERLIVYEYLHKIAAADSNRKFNNFGDICSNHTAQEDATGEIFNTPQIHSEIPGDTQGTGDTHPVRRPISITEMHYWIVSQSSSFAVTLPCRRLCAPTEEELQPSAVLPGRWPGRVGLLIGTAARGQPSLPWRG